jgi:hypothetical protein
MTFFSPISRLAAAVLLGAALLLAGCDSNDSGMTDEDEPLRQVSYSLAAQSNNGAIPDGVDGTVTFWELSDTQTLVTLELTDGETGASVAHPAHIHENDAATGGDIAYYLSPIAGTGGGGTSARVVDESFDTLADFDGYVNIHESAGNLGVVVSQGDIGSNADATPTDGLTLVEGGGQSETYDLSANMNGGSIAPDGIAGTATFREVTADLTLVTLELNISGATGASVSHPAHIHNNDASTGGGIAIHLSPIDGTDGAAKSSKLIARPFSELASFDGYINIHESFDNLGAVVSQGNIGANATGSDGGGGGDDGGSDGGGGRY